MRYFFRIVFIVSTFILCNADPMRLRVDSPANGQVFLPLGDTDPVVSVSISWGDGSSGNYTAPALWYDGTAGIDHIYTVAGRYEIVISPFGDGPIYLSRFGWKDGSGWPNSGSLSFSPYTATFASMLAFGNLGTTSLRGCFAGASINANSLPFSSPPTVTDMAGMFYKSNFLGTSYVGNYMAWNVASVTDMSYMFASASTFNLPLNQWDVRNVRKMRGMFAGALAFNQPLYSWNVGNVVDMDDMFMSTSSFQQSLATWCVPQIATRPTGFADGSKLLATQEPAWGCISPSIPRDSPAEQPQAAPVSVPVAEPVSVPSADPPVFVETPAKTPFFEPPVGNTPAQPTPLPSSPMSQPPAAASSAPGTALRVLPAVAMLHHNSRSCNDISSTRSLVSAVWHRGACSSWGHEDNRVYYQIDGEPSDIIHQKRCSDAACSKDCAENILSTNDCSHGKDSFFALRPGNASSNDLGDVFPSINVNMHASFIISVSYATSESCQAHDLSAAVAQYWDRREIKSCVPSDSNPNHFFKYDCTSDGRIQIQTFSDADCKPRHEVGSPQEYLVLDSCTQAHQLASSSLNYGGPATPWTLSCAAGAKLQGEVRSSSGVSPNQPSGVSSTNVRVSAGGVLASSSPLITPSTILAVLIVALIGIFTSI